MAHLSDSSVQRSLELPVLLKGCKTLGLDPSDLVQSKRISVGQGEMVIVDGWVERNDEPVAFEVYVSLGAPKSAQGQKLRSDLLKLVLLQRALPTPPLGYILVTAPEAAAWLGKGWMGRAMDVLNVRCLLIPLTRAQRKELASARRKQAQGITPNR